MDNNLLDRKINLNGIPHYIGTGWFSPLSDLRDYLKPRNLILVIGDSGAWLWDTRGALVLCGVPAEEYWTCDIKDFDK